MTLSRLAVFSSLSLALFIIAAPRTLHADLDKEELKKKQEAEAKPSLDDADGEDFYKNLARQGEKNLREINELLKKVQKDLSRKSTGEETQKLQRQAVEKLERLIQEIAKASQQSASSSSQQQQEKQKQKQQQQQQQQKQRREQEKMQAQQTESEKQKNQKERNDQQNREHERLETPPSQEKPGSLMARLRQNARWGLLPRKVTEALASSDKEAPAEYKEIIARYYKRMTEYYDRNR